MLYLTLGLFSAAVVCILIFNKKIAAVLSRAEIGENRPKTFKAFQTFYLFMIAVAFLLVAVMSSFSSFNVHPDEMDTIECIKYFVKHWAFPDLRNPLISSTFTLYGTSRLSELNLYYLIAGKLTALVTLIHSYSRVFRLMNLLLFLALCCIAAKNRKNSKSLVFVLLVTPQLWYLYSYTTSDAFDFFISFVCLYQLVKPDSIFNKYLDGGWEKKSFLCAVCLSVPISLLLMAKKNYFVIPVMIFLVLLFRFLHLNRELKKGNALKQTLIHI